MIAPVRHLVQRAQVGLLAALLFWAPSLIVHLARATNSTKFDVRMLTWLLPLVTLMGLWLIPKVWARFVMDAWGTLAAALGIWFFGPLFIMVGWMNAGGGFSGSLSWVVAVFEMALFPIFTFIMSVYDGTLGALLIVTGSLLLRALLVWSRQWPVAADAQQRRLLRKPDASFVSAPVAF